MIALFYRKALFWRYKSHVLNLSCVNTWLRVKQHPPPPKNFCRGMWRMSLLGKSSCVWSKAIKTVKTEELGGQSWHEPPLVGTEHGDVTVKEGEACINYFSGECTARKKGENTQIFYPSLRTLCLQIVSILLARAVPWNLSPDCSRGNKEIGSKCRDNNKMLNLFFWGCSVVIVPLQVHYIKKSKSILASLPSSEETQLDFYAGHVHELASLSKQLAEGALFFICSPGLLFRQKLSPVVLWKFLAYLRIYNQIIINSNVRSWRINRVCFLDPHLAGLYMKRKL